MAHATEIVKQEQIRDDRIAVTVRCCGDSLTDSTHTFNVTGSTPSDVEKWIDGLHDQVRQKHQNMQAGLQHLTSIPNRTKVHAE